VDHRQGNVRRPRSKARKEGVSRIVILRAQARKFISWRRRRMRQYIAGPESGPPQYAGTAKFPTGKAAVAFLTYREGCLIGQSCSA
jgi:hypothetical protein